jgi:hypothetical protein
MRTLSLTMMGVLFGCGAAAAADKGAPGNPDTIHVNAMRDPAVRKYGPIVKGLEAFERHKAMAPRVDVLRFRIEPSSGPGTGNASEAAPPVVKLEGDDGFVLPLLVDANNEMVVPYNKAALDADSEITLNRKRSDYRIETRVRTPGLPDDVWRLGDMRLECKVRVAIGKEEIGLMWTLTVNSILRTRDWCTFLDKQRAGFSFRASRRVTQAILYEGNLSRALEFEGRSVRVPLHDPIWSDEALIELTFEAPVPDAMGTVTGTAGETPRTAP